MFPVKVQQLQNAIVKMSRRSPLSPSPMLLSLFVVRTLTSAPSLAGAQLGFGMGSDGDSSSDNHDPEPEPELEPEPESKVAESSAAAEAGGKKKKKKVCYFWQGLLLSCVCYSGASIPSQ
jgi:hypothetical protein